MHSLTTRARAERHIRQQLLAQKPAAQPQPTRQLSAAARWVLTRLLAILALAILGCALWPDGQTRPLSYCQPKPAPTAATYAF